MSSQAGLTIGQVAREVSCSVASIRYYEEIGLLPAAGRRLGGHRVYGAEDVKRLLFIRRCREFGFPIGKVRELMRASSAETPCREAREIAQSHLATVQTKVAELMALESALAGFVANCTANCPTAMVGECTLFDDIAGQRPADCCGFQKLKNAGA